MANVFVLMLPGAVCLRIEVRHYECLGWVSQSFHCLKSHFRAVFFFISALKHCRLWNVETVLKGQVKKQEAVLVPHSELPSVLLLIMFIQKLFNVHL